MDFRIPSGGLCSEKQTRVKTGVVFSSKFEGRLAIWTWVRLNNFTSSHHRPENRRTIPPPDSPAWLPGIKINEPGYQGLTDFSERILARCWRGPHCGRRRPCRHTSSQLNATLPPAQALIQNYPLDSAQLHRFTLMPSSRTPDPELLRDCLQQYHPLNVYFWDLAVRFT